MDSERDSCTVCVILKGMQFTDIRCEMQNLSSSDKMSTISSSTRSFKSITNQENNCSCSHHETNENLFNLIKKSCVSVVERVTIMIKTYKKQIVQYVFSLFCSLSLSFIRIFRKFSHILTMMKRKTKTEQQFKHQQQATQTVYAIISKIFTVKSTTTTTQIPSTTTTQIPTTTSNPDGIWNNIENFYN